MADRRTFLKCTAALTAAPAAAAAAARAEPAGAGIGTFVYDERFGAGRALAAQMSGRGATVHAIGGDVTALWFGTLDAAWRGRPESLAGVTDENALFVLERLAWDRGLRVVFSTEAPASAEAVAAWSASAANALSRGEAWRVAEAPAPATSRFGGARTRLLAWIIAAKASLGSEGAAAEYHELLPSNGGRRRET